MDTPNLTCVEFFVLTETETRELVIYLTHKWLNCDSDGYNGQANVSWIALGSKSPEPPDDPETVTIEVPAGEVLTIGRLNGGRGNGTACPVVEKTGAGTLMVGESADFGGQLAVRDGTLKMKKPKTVPSFEDLAPYLTLHLDPSDATSLTVDDDGSVSAWANTAAYALTSLETNSVVQADPTRCPTRIRDALGAGLDVLDFGRYGASGKYMAFQPTRAYQTIIAVVDARMYGGGNVMSLMFRHYSPATLDNATPWEASPLSLLLATVENGTVTNPIALSGTLTFEDGAQISVQGFDENVRTGDRLVLGTVEAVHGLDNVTFDFGERIFAVDASLSLTFRRKRLVVRFSTRGTLLLMR